MSQLIHALLAMKRWSVFSCIINNDWWGFCDIQNNQGQGRGYQPKPMAEADNLYRDPDPEILVSFAAVIRVVT